MTCFHIPLILVLKASYTITKKNNIIKKNLFFNFKVSFYKFLGVALNF